jgi:arylsulfatase A-like enzyme
MKGSDVLLVVLETGPARCLRFDGDLSAYPNLRRLREHAVLGLEHYTTAPLTNKALHSLLTSRYPPTSYRESQEAPGMLSSLTALGYETACFSPKNPSSMVPGDERRLRGLGFQRLNWPREGCVSGRATSWQQKVACDSAALAMLRDDLRHRPGRFAYMFLPLLSHAPWEDVTGGEARDLVSRRRALLAYEDRWLGQVIDELERLGRLERTIIVVTADHGIRTRREDPDFRVGYLDDYTFHVPLLIYAPGALRATQPIPWLTSHIDVAPTVLDLLGVEGGRSYEEGSTIWDSRLQERTTFFFAQSFLGADAYAEHGRFTMIRHLPASVFRSDRLHFELGDMAPVDEQARPTLERMVRLQQALGRVTAATP